MNRATNLVVASLYIPVSVFNAVGASWDLASFYGLSIGIEVLILAFILLRLDLASIPRRPSRSRDDRPSTVGIRVKSYGVKPAAAGGVGGKLASRGGSVSVTVFPADLQ